MNEWIETIYGEGLKVNVEFMGDLGFIQRAQVMQ